MALKNCQNKDIVVGGHSYQRKVYEIKSLMNKEKIMIPKNTKIVSIYASLIEKVIS